MNNIFCITDSDILDVYREEGKLKDYNHCLKYIESKRFKLKEDSIYRIAKILDIRYATVRHWLKKERIPNIIKILNYLNEKELLPYIPNERTARIIGFLYGDGCLIENLYCFSFKSNELNIINKLKEDIKKEFNLLGKIKITAYKGKIREIIGKRFITRENCYELRYSSRALSLLLFKLGVPKGKKVEKTYLISKWVMEGNKNIKRAFLQGFFDAELANSTITSYTKYGYYYKNQLARPSLEQSKRRNLRKNLEDFFNQIIQLLKEFEVEAKLGYIRDRGEENISAILFFSNKLLNIYKLNDNIGFYYSENKRQKGLKIKNLILEKSQKFSKIKENIINKTLEV